MGGLLVSVAESLGAVFLKPSLKELVSFSLLIADPALPPRRALRQARGVKWLALGRRVAVLLVLPAVLELLRASTVFILIFFYAFLGQAWNIVGGYAGQLSAGHAAFVGIGGYTVGAAVDRARAHARGSACSWAARWPPCSAR